MIGIPLGFLYANATEWVAHRFILHGWGKRKDSFWNFHWGEHHRHVRKNGHRDETYLKPLLSAWNPKSKETVALTFGVAAHLPLAPIAPFFVGTVAYSAMRYYRLHRRSHLDIEWAKENLPWHYDHHMGKDQDANWCVTHPFFDIIMGTRRPYLRTVAERQDQMRRIQRASRNEARKAASGDVSSEPMVASVS